jgi:hypothetical protein
MGPHFRALIGRAASGCDAQHGGFDRRRGLAADRDDRELGWERMPRYQKVLWHHDRPDEPVVLYSEIDSGFEVRKVEVYRDGRRDYADRSRSTGTTMLSENVMPAVDEINEDPEFSAEAITSEEFGQLWQRASGAV